MPQAQPDTPPRDEVHYRLLRLLAERPQASQRDLARALGVSLGKVNYCLRALLDQGWIKASNFRNSRNKLAYLYVLTPSGIEARARLTRHFLQRKLTEYESIVAEIAQLRAETEQTAQSMEPGPD